MSEKTNGFKIEESQRQSWLSIAAVWAGGMICVPCLMIGGVLAGGGLSLGQIILSILIGYGIICAYMIFIGMQACDTGLPVSVMASGALGEKGARYIISTLLAIACVGWFGIQSATCGSAFATGCSVVAYSWRKNSRTSSTLPSSAQISSSERPWLRASAKWDSKSFKISSAAAESKDARPCFNAFI